MMVWIIDANARHVVRQLNAQKTACDEVGKYGVQVWALSIK